MAAAAGTWLLCVVVAGIFLPEVGSTWGSWWGGGMGSTYPHNCPHEDPETHVCSRLHNKTRTLYQRVCCGRGRDGDESDDDDSHSDSESDSESDSDEHRHMCRSWCWVKRNVTYYKCVTECCEGYQPSKNGTCQNKTNEIECHNGGTKMRWPDGSQYCNCGPCFAGKTCEIPLGFCQNGGTCTGHAVCTCPDGYHGAYCEYPPCSLACHNGGTCVRDDDTEMCNCTLPYVGELCETRHTDSPQCPAVRSDQDPTQDCLLQCYNDGDCSSGSVCCQDGCSLICKRPKTSMCEMDGRTFAVGEIYRPNSCKKCTCVEPGEFECTSIDSCPTFRCQDGSLPVEQPGQCCPACAVPCYCYNGGSCMLQAGQQVCRCPTGYHGKYCEHRTCSLQCYNGGTCVREDETETCRCTLPFIGKQCERRYTDSPMCPEASPGSNQTDDCDISCHNDSQCTGNTVCCQDGCSLVCKKPKIVTCQKDGRTFNVGEEYSPNPCMTCTCMESGIMACKSISCPSLSCPDGSHPVTKPGQCCPVCSVPCKCANGGSCVLTDGKPVCTCPVGYEGQLCEHRTCNLQCYNGGICTRDDGAETCKCKLPYVGKQCELKHTDSPLCPEALQETDQDCDISCHNDTECVGNTICCQDGCSLVCKKPKTVTCEKDGRTFAVGEKYSPNPCTTCICIESGSMACSDIACDIPSCPVGSYPISKPGICCPVCSDPAPEPPTITCPVHPIYLDVGPTNGALQLSDEDTGVYASDGNGDPIKVLYEPDQLRHCSCVTAKHKTVVASAKDKDGETASCTLQVHVRDPYPPVASYCPKNINMMKGELVIWHAPSFVDNVGIYRQESNVNETGGVFPPGRHTVEYKAWDFDGNLAVCRFVINVTKNAPPPEPEPPTIDCPKTPVTIDVGPEDGTAKLSTQNTKVYAYDSTISPLPVTFEPSYLQHCACHRIGSYPERVVAKTRDRNGGVASCTLHVYIRDPHPPVVTSCPENVFIFTGKQPQWTEPDFKDNVGVANSKTIQQPQIRNSVVGNYSVEYRAWDYDGNQALCQFTVTVMDRATPNEDLPQEFRERVKSSEEEQLNLGLIIGPVLAAIGLIALIVALCVCCKFKRRSKLNGKAATPVPSQYFDNHIYHLPSDVMLKPPANYGNTKTPSVVSKHSKAHSTHSKRSKASLTSSVRSKAPSVISTHSKASSVSSRRSSPPPYSSTCDLREIQYAYICPPTYAESVCSMPQSYVNPGYKTLERKSMQ